MILYKKLPNKINKIITLFILILLIIVLIFLSYFVFGIYRVRAVFENDVLSIAESNSKTNFSLDKIYLFSSADATNNDNLKALWDLNIYQYTDIAIFINNNSSKRLKF